MKQISCTFRRFKGGGERFWRKIVDCWVSFAGHLYLATWEGDSTKNDRGSDRVTTQAVSICWPENDTQQSAFLTNSTVNTFQYKLYLLFLYNDEDIANHDKGCYWIQSQLNHIFTIRKKDGENWFYLCSNTGTKFMGCIDSSRDFHRNLIVNICKLKRSSL